MKTRLNDILQVNKDNKCSLSVRHISQVHLLNEKEEFSGLLIRFSASSLTAAAAGSTHIQWEAHVKQRDKFVLIKPFGDISRISQLQVSTHT